MRKDLQLIGTLIRKEIILEWRQKYAFNGMLLYVFSTVFIAYLVFERMQVTHWISLFWIIMLFASVNAVAKSFLQESRARMLYYYTIARPEHVIISKSIYSFLLLLILAMITFFIFSVLIDNPVRNHGYWFLVLLLGTAGFAFAFTLVSAIASKARNNATLMTILSFPIILPQLGLLINLSKGAVSGMSIGSGQNDLVALLAVDAIVIVVAYLLFPYLWRE